MVRVSSSGLGGQSIDVGPLEGAVSFPPSRQVDQGVASGRDDDVPEVGLLEVPVT